ncbi:hypothetical protein M0Q97_07510 [Candidatus Dojkabacteria bacterium]|jgi:hypothetical protein|nr:hypothetical protein [Candidatus Dojkabacteria bacterium]
MEKNDTYGKHRRYDVGTCLKTKNGCHYYKQLDLNLLHIANMELINLVYNSIVDNEDLIVISEKEFEETLKITIFNLDIFKYCTPTDYTKN